MTMPLRTLTEKEHTSLIRGLCPECGSTMLCGGPVGGLSQNVLCGYCRVEFNHGPLHSELLGPCEPERQKEIYHIDADKYPAKNFALARHALGVEELEKALAKGCDDPECQREHPPGGLGELYLSGRCHPGAGVSVCYRKNTGQAWITCRECSRPVVVLNIAETGGV